MKQPHPLMVCLKQIRESRGLSVSAAADGSGLSRWSLADWEAGDHDPNLATLGPYMEFLGVRLTVTALEADEDLGDQLPYEDPMIAPGEKLCRGCGQIRSLERGFHRNRTRRDGRMSQCKWCAKDRRQERMRAVAA